MEGNTKLKERTVPMEVLVLGLCRTGTMSMKIALEKLGYANVYHFSSVFEHQSHPDLWITALKAKYEPDGVKSKLFAKSDWNNLLGDYSAVTDIPSACCAPELMAAYPSAKIILTTRSTASWHASMLRTIHALQVSYLNRFLLLFSARHLQNLSKLMDLIIQCYFRGNIPAFGTEVFVEHNEMVKGLARVQNRSFLEFKLGDGWEELCGFLGKPVPDADFPRVNQRESWRRSFGLGWSWKNLLLLVLSSVVGLAGIWLAARPFVANDSWIALRSK